MKFISILVLALSSALLPVAAMQHLSDSELSHIEGQAKVVVLADLRVEIESIGSNSAFSQTFFRLQDLLLSGRMGTTVSVLSGSAYKAELANTLKFYGVQDGQMEDALASLNPPNFGQSSAHVAQVTFPDLTASALGKGMDFSVRSIQWSENSPSMGGLHMKGIDPSGTKIWIVRH